MYINLLTALLGQSYALPLVVQGLSSFLQVTTFNFYLYSIHFHILIIQRPREFTSQSAREAF